MNEERRKEESVERESKVNEEEEEKEHVGRRLLSMEVEGRRKKRGRPMKICMSVLCERFEGKKGKRARSNKAKEKTIRKRLVINSRKKLSRQRKES